MEIYYVKSSRVTKGTPPIIRIFYCSNRVSSVLYTATKVNIEWKTRLRE